MRETQVPIKLWSSIIFMCCRVDWESSVAKRERNTTTRRYKLYDWLNEKNSRVSDKRFSVSRSCKSSLSAFTWKPFAPIKWEDASPICTTWTTWNNEKTVDLSQSFIFHWLFRQSCHPSFFNFQIGKTLTYHSKEPSKTFVKLRFPEISKIRLFSIFVIDC